MKNLTDLKNLLYNDVKKYYDTRGEIQRLEEKTSLYNELLNIFDYKNLKGISFYLMNINLILSSLYDRDTVQTFRVKNILNEYNKAKTDEEKQYCLNKLEKIYLKLKLDYEFEKEKLDKINEEILTKDEFIISKRIISSLKYKQMITDEEKQFVLNHLKKANYDMKDIITIIEKLKIHNSKLNTPTSTKYNSKELYNLINLMQQGYEIIEEPDEDNKTLDVICERIIKLLNGENEETIREILNNLNYYNAEYLTYIYTKLMIYYQNEMFDTIEALKDEDCYFDADIVNVAKNDYYNSYMKYTIIRNLLDNLVKKEEPVVEIEEEINEEEVIVNHLYYSTNNLDDFKKCYFVNDLQDIREESLNTILELIKNFKMGKNVQTKYLVKCNGCFEIKNDQIRIVLKSLGSNDYSVMGVFIKKANNNHNKYQSVCNRPIAIINDEYSMAVETYYEEYIQESARKGTR